MVRMSLSCAVLVLVACSSASAEDAQTQMFPRSDSCYSRTYGPGHLARHPEQRVDRFSITPDFVSEAPRLALELRLGLRGNPGGAFGAYALCKTTGPGSLSCSMEGDAGTFQITPAKNKSVLVTVGTQGMSFENNTGFVTLDPDKGDDRSFILRPARCK